MKNEQSIKFSPGILQIIFVLFFVGMGLWMFINPYLNAYPQDDHLNYPALFFCALGISFTFTFRRITVGKEGIEIFNLMIRKKTYVPRNDMRQIVIEEDTRTQSEILLTGGRKRHPSRITITFKSPISDIVLGAANGKSYYETCIFFRENYENKILEHNQNDDFLIQN